jgi:hypothetical protein
VQTWQTIQNKKDTVGRSGRIRLLPDMIWRPLAADAGRSGEGMQRSGSQARMTGGSMPRGMMPVSDCNKKSMTVRIAATRRGMEPIISIRPLMVLASTTVAAGRHRPVSRTLRA